MKNFIKIIIGLVLVGFFFVSCKKTDYHKVTFEVTFLESPSTGASNFIDILVTPKGENVTPINRFDIPKVWRYEHVGLEKGDLVQMVVSPQLSYHFEMRVYIDDKQVSYRRIKTSDFTYYSVHVEESYGRNEGYLATQESSSITFKY